MVAFNTRQRERVSAMESRAGLQAQPRQQTQAKYWQAEYRGELARVARQTSDGPPSNVASAEQLVSVAAGGIVAIMGVARGSKLGLGCAALGGYLVYRGVTGRCPVYSALGIDSAREETADASTDPNCGVQIVTAVTINRPADRLYTFWRDFANLPRFMRHLEAVEVHDDRRSRWTAQAPKPGSKVISWEAEVVRDVSNELIEWRSLPGSEIDTAGQVRFIPALGDRGTEVHVWMHYTPPGGRLGHLVTSMLGFNPKRMIREDLRNFQRLMELGEILTIAGQPVGTCTGQGTTATESRWKPLFT